MTPKLLLNENVPAPAAASLRAHGLDLLAITEAQPGIADEQVMALAVCERAGSSRSTGTTANWYSAGSSSHRRRPSWFANAITALQSRLTG